MKKIYLLGVSAVLTCSVFAQSAKIKTYQSSKKINISSNKGIKTPNQIQATFFTNDFSNPADWVSNDVTGMGQAWQIGTTGPVQIPTFLINSTSGGNFAMFDSDGASQTDPNNAELILVNPVSCVGHPDVNLVFEQHYQRYMDSTYVAVSNDNGANWTEYQVNAGYATGGAAESPDPEMVTVNISSVAGNQPAVLVKFIFRGFWDYWWLVDDVTFQDVPTTDASITAVTLPATGCLTGTATTPITTTIFNIGLDSIYNFDLSYSVDGGAPVIETYTDTIVGGATANYTFTTTADVSSEGTHTVDVTIIVTGDGNAANDMGSASFDNAVPNDLSNVNYANSFETADPDLFMLYIQQTPSSGSTANWQWSTTTPHTGTRCLNLQAPTAIADAWNMFKCMNITAGDTYRLIYWTRTNTNYNGGISVSLGTGQTAADMVAGIEIKPYVATTPGNVWRKDSVDYLAPVSGTIYLGIRGAGTATGSGTMVKLDDVSITKVVPVGVKENVLTAEAITVFPNPNNGVFTIRALENNSSVEVYNIIGEKVYTSNMSKGYNTVELANLAAGSYIVKVKSGEYTISKRVVINK
ncbi:MAG: T9SS type A sorting domain-containing protein [Bacteroidota bacterium]|nr:T9SS type A sorting domain-containing protein [Bacteroidota bacterium]